MVCNLSKTSARCIYVEFFPQNVLNEPLVERREAPVFDVGVVLECTHRNIASVKQGASLSVPVWSLSELLVRGQIDPQQQSAQQPIEKTVIQNLSDSGADQTGNSKVLWTGFRLAFFRDGGESYWHTLVGEQQQLFVVCQDDENEEFTPILVTADYDEAMAYQEADDTIFSAPMPAKIYQVIERFVLENYAPAAKKKRKRKNWHGEESDEAFARKPEV